MRTDEVVEIEAVYENGVIRPLSALRLREGSRLRVALREAGPDDGRTAQAAPEEYDLVDMEGLGTEYWRSIDVDAYIEGERGSWD
jgi:predicted DNA-binding antitoxin AbrB/MazE fold protein